MASDGGSGLAARGRRRKVEAAWTCAAWSPVAHVRTCPGRIRGDPRGGPKVGPLPASRTRARTPTTIGPSAVLRTVGTRPLLRSRASDRPGDAVHPPGPARPVARPQHRGAPTVSEAGARRLVAPVLAETRRSRNGADIVTSERRTWARWVRANHSRRPTRPRESLPSDPSAIWATPTVPRDHGRTTAPAPARAGDRTRGHGARPHHSGRAANVEMPPDRRRTTAAGAPGPGNRAGSYRRSGAEGAMAPARTGPPLERGDGVEDERSVLIESCVGGDGALRRHLQCAILPLYV